MHDPDPWREVALCDVASITVGGTPSTAVSSFWGGDIPWMASGDVHQRRIADVPGRISALGLRSSNATLVDPPSVAIGLAGQGKTRGTAALVERRVCTNQSVALISGDAEHLLTSYLFRDLDRRYEELRARSSGGGRGGLSKAILERIPLRLPSVREQAVISRILDTVDDEIVVTERLIAKLEHVKQGLLHDLLTRGIDDNDMLRDPIRQPSGFADTVLGQLPTAWRVIPLAECVKHNAPITYGIVQAGPHVVGGIPYVRTGDMAGDELRRDDLLCTSQRVADAYKRSTVREGEIVCAIRATVGKVLPVPAELDGANLTQGTARISPRPSVHPGFLLWALRSQRVQRQFSLAVKGTTSAEITLAALRDLPIPVPCSPEEQQAIADRMSTVDVRISVERNSLDALVQLKQGLMDDLLTGRVRVTVDEDAA